MSHRVLYGRFIIAALKRVLFLSYNGMLEPIFQSQGLPYLKHLANQGRLVVLLTFEKKRDVRRAGIEKLTELQKNLKGEKILWHWSSYHKRPPLVSTVFDIGVGFIRAWVLARKYSVHLIHARGSIPASFGWPVAKILNKPFLFDMRGFLAEEYADGGIWKRNGQIFRLVWHFEKRFLESADWVVVLTNRAANYLRQKAFLPKNASITVIPCCVDFRRF